jgi:hypothetical protein
MLMMAAVVLAAAGPGAEVRTSLPHQANRISTFRAEEISSAELRVRRLIEFR